jgi:hypothetical protein
MLSVVAAGCLELKTQIGDRPILLGIVKTEGWAVGTLCRLLSFLETCTLRDATFTTKEPVGSDHA